MFALVNITGFSMIRSNRIWNTGACHWTGKTEWQ